MTGRMSTPRQVTNLTLSTRWEGTGIRPSGPGINFPRQVRGPYLPNTQGYRLGYARWVNA